LKHDAFHRPLLGPWHRTLIVDDPRVDQFSLLPQSEDLKVETFSRNRWRSAPSASTASTVHGWCACSPLGECCTAMRKVSGKHMNAPEYQAATMLLQLRCGRTTLIQH
jgi:hypothetical protein